MKKLINTFVGMAMLLFFFTACDQDDTAALEDHAQISEEVLFQIKQLGFSTENVIREEDYYIVEGDIKLHEHDLDRVPVSTLLRVAEEEQYHTFNLVAGPRVITISVSGRGVSSALSNAVNAAIARYNAENLELTFQRVSSNGDINIDVRNGGGYIASAGFPDDQGNPYPEVTFNKRYQNYSAGFLTTVIAHEVGHCIGFRHTDYMNRSFSCGSGGNEGQETTGVGAVHIPGTPTGPDAASWMLACLSSSTDRPFNNNDKVALDYLY